MRPGDFQIILLLLTGRQRDLHGHGDIIKDFLVPAAHVEPTEKRHAQSNGSRYHSINHKTPYQYRLQAAVALALGVVPRLLKRSARRRDRFSRGTASSRPLTASDMRPVSSLTTRSTASVSSLAHSAARWRIPIWGLLPSGGWLNGSWQAAAR